MHCNSKDAILYMTLSTFKEVYQDFYKLYDDFLHRRELRRNRILSTNADYKFRSRYPIKFIYLLFSYIRIIFY